MNIEHLQNQIQEWQKQIIQQKENVIRLEGAISAYAFLIDEYNKQEKKEPVKK
tara:strand:- start:919 stop:1077 length:159 start_codon:yes stop_codon:yes gene_type:complete